jgi:dephospho-CoA kinase
MNRNDEGKTYHDSIEKRDKTVNINTKPYVVILTGGIATGKSETSKYLRELGYVVLDSDKIVHDGYKKDSNLYKSLIEMFSHDILDREQNIDRQKLGKIVFADDEKLKKLNNLVHKYVRNVLIDGINKCSDEVIFLDIPLFFEGRKSLENAGFRYDETWLVYVSEETQKNRLKQRAISENKDVEQAINIIKKQMPIEEKRLLADKVINNEGSIEDLRREISSLLELKSLYLKN